MQSRSTETASESRTAALARDVPRWRLLSPWAVARGAAVGAGGGLAMTSLIGVAAVLGMIRQGLPPEAIPQRLYAAIDIQLFIIAAWALMAFAAGYTAASAAPAASISCSLGRAGDDRSEAPDPPGIRRSLAGLAKRRRFRAGVAVCFGRSVGSRRKGAGSGDRGQGPDLASREGAGARLRIPHRVTPPPIIS